MNDVLGYINCTDCGTRGTVHQAKRGKGRYLYKRCDCGCDQRNGKSVQTALYYNTDWIVQPIPERPANVDENPPQPAKEPIAAAQPKVADEPIADKPEKTDGKKSFLMAAGSAVAFAFLVLIGRRS